MIKLSKSLGNSYIKGVLYFWKNSSFHSLWNKTINLKISEEHKIWSLTKCKIEPFWIVSKPESRKTTLCHSGPFNICISSRNGSKSQIVDDSYFNRNHFFLLLLLESKPVRQSFPSSNLSFIVSLSSLSSPSTQIELMTVITIEQNLSLSSIHTILATILKHR